MRYKTFESLDAFITEKLENKQINECLEAIQKFVENVNKYNFLNGHFLHSKALDDLCLKIGKTAYLKYNKSDVKLNYINIFLATQLYMSGGHTAVIKDYITNSPKHIKNYIILTGINNSFRKNIIIKAFENHSVKLIFLDKKNKYEKLLEIQQLWLKLNPRNIFLFNHPQDSVAISSAQPEMPGELYFYHHVDFKLCLGASLEHALHIDFNVAHLHDCKDKAGVNNIYVPLVCEDLLEKNTSNIYKLNKEIRTATSGYFEKFTGTYLYNYFLLLPSIIQATNGTHIHIGYLPPPVIWKIKSNLRKSNIPLERFIYIKWTKSLTQTLFDFGVNLYITSFPVGGGRAAIEVMSAGLPIISHINYHATFLSETHLLYPEAFFWSNSRQLLECLSNIKFDDLKNHSTYSRLHYERYYSIEILKKVLESDFTYIAPMPILIDSNNFTINKEQFYLDIISENTCTNSVLQNIYRMAKRIYQIIS